VSPLPDGTPSSRDVLEHIYREQGPIHGPAYDQARAVARVRDGNGEAIERAVASSPTAAEAEVDSSRQAHSAGDSACGAVRVLTIAELLTLQIPEREAILSPWLLTQSLTMLHSYRGVGKTHVALGVGYAVATGGSFLTWRAERPRPVLYLDGEMPAAALRDRLRALVEADQRDFDPAMLRIVTPDVQDGPMPDLATAEGQLLVEGVIGAAELLIVDNISTLVRDTGRENEAESWREVGAWALRMRQRGRAVLFVHHDGKSGQQRGTSKREDTLDVVIQLKHPPDYSPDHGARFEVHFRKYRPRPGAEVKPIEARLSVHADERHSWIWRDLEEGTFERVVGLANDGLRPGEIANELGIHKSRVSRHLKRARIEDRVSATGYCD
jgi:hypothetical protein